MLDRSDVENLTPWVLMEKQKGMVAALRQQGRAADFVGMQAAFEQVKPSQASTMHTHVSCCCHHTHTHSHTQTNTHMPAAANTGG